MSLPKIVDATILKCIVGSWFIGFGPLYRDVRAWCRHSSHRVGSLLNGLGPLYHDVRGGVWDANTHRMVGPSLKPSLYEKEDPMNEAGKTEGCCRPHLSVQLSNGVGGHYL